MSLLSLDYTSGFTKRILYYRIIFEFLNASIDITRQHKDINHQEAYWLFKIVLPISNFLSDLMQSVQCQSSDDVFQNMLSFLLDSEKMLGFTFVPYTHRSMLHARRENVQRSTIFLSSFPLTSTSFELKNHAGYRLQVLHS